MTFNFTELTAQEVDVIANALGQRPFVEVHQLLVKIQKQVSEQQTPKTEE